MSEQPAPSCPKWEKDADERETAGFRAAVVGATIEMCRRSAAGVPTDDDLREWHSAVFADVVPLAYYAGNYRQIDARMPCMDYPVQVNNNPGSSPLDVTVHMSQLLPALKARLDVLDIGWDNKSPTARVEMLALLVGTAVGRFVQIHPFRNGNGRTSRAFWRALLYRFGAAPQGTVVRRPPQPYGSIMNAAMVGDFGPCILHVLRGLSQPAGLQRRPSPE